MARDETTASGRHLEPSQERAPSLIWKLRVLFAACVGIVKTEAKPVRERAPLLIGRGTATTAAGLRLLLEDARVSREHARVSIEGSRAVVEDPGSKNGTEVNGSRLASGEPFALKDGDVLRLGDSFLLVRHESGTVPDAPIPSIVGVSQAACRLRSTLARCALANSSVMLLGETGTGKGAAAAAIHAFSRLRGSFIAVNCAALPATLAESMFFGVQSGAFTGAVEHAGFLGEAHNGTLFLDEVGDLPRDLQPKLLRAVETQQVTPLGRARPVPCHARIIAATNRDLTAALRSGGFREDLYHRLTAVVVHLPPLFTRREDILLLAAHLGGHGFRPSPSLVAAMLRYHWPGHVREVGNVTQRVSMLGEAEVVPWLTSQSADPRLAPSLSPQTTGPQPALWRTGDPAPTHDEIAALLERYRGSLRRIEIEVGYSRRQFQRWVERYGIDLGKYRQNTG